jgi:hypothetical protein
VQLKADVRYKAFSQNTSIQILMGVKIYANHMRLFWGKRAAVGYGMRIMHTSPKLRINEPMTLVFNLPANLIFWGLPALPPLPTPEFPFSFEALRQEIQELFP